MLPPFSESRRLVQGGKGPKRLSPQSSAPKSFLVGCAGSARYSADECRENGTRVVPQRLQPLSLAKEAKAVFHLSLRTSAHTGVAAPQIFRALKWLSYHPYLNIREIATTVRTLSRNDILEIIKWR